MARHVTLIRPPFVTTRSALVGAEATPSLAMALLGAVLERAGHEVTAIDATGEALRQYIPLDGTPYFMHGLKPEQIVRRIPAHTDLIGVTCMFSNEWFCHRRIIEAISDAFPGVPIVVGGEHATAAAADVLKACPKVVACALGEGEDTMLDLMAALESGQDFSQVPGLMVRDGEGGVMKTGPRSRIRHLDELPWPAWHLLPLRAYLDAGAGHGVVGKRTMPMLASRGCPYRCTFCSNPQMWGKLWNIRAPEDVVAEMRYYNDHYEVECCSFYDLTAVIRREWILEFTRLLEEQSLNVLWLLPSGTRSEALDLEVVSAMRRSGCLTLNLAPETGSEVTLKRIKKRVKLDNMLKTVEACTRAGIVVRANIIFGFPDESPREMLKTLRFMIKMAWRGLHDVGVFPFAPYPGSEMHDELRQRGAFPESPEAYEMVLAANLNNNYGRPRSWNERLSDAQLRNVIVGTTVIFYLAQYTFRPQRLALTVYRLVAGQPITLMERVLANLLRRAPKMTPRVAPPRAGKVDPGCP
ncbi:MAG: radical SAM protein [Candidatus Hydrogenedentes bacterium]|nr:radical SAM protein [Candidatus Hydrogenedentota bacterium]